MFYDLAALQYHIRSRCDTEDLNLPFNGIFVHAEVLHYLSYKDLMVQPDYDLPLLLACLR